MIASAASTADVPRRSGCARMNDRAPSRDDPTALMTRVRATRDREAFKALFLHFAPRVKSYLIRQGASPAQAEELAQETLLIIWREADRFEPGRKSVAGWIFTIARNLRIDVIRRERSALAYTLATVEPEPLGTPETDSCLAEREARLLQAVRELPDEQVDLLRRSFFLETTHAEIARDLTLPLGTVKSRIRRAIRSLRSRLGDLA